jgi:hypothetical protein
VRTAYRGIARRPIDAADDHASVATSAELDEINAIQPNPAKFPLADYRACQFDCPQ